MIVLTYIVVVDEVFHFLLKKFKEKEKEKKID